MSLNNTINNNEIGMCSICHTNFNATTMATLRNCRHTFHFECVQRSIVEVGRSCPMCRAAATEDEIQQLVIASPFPDEEETSINQTEQKVQISFFMSVSWTDINAGCRIVLHDLMLTFSVQLIFAIIWYFRNDVFSESTLKKQANVNIHQFFLIIKHSYADVTDLIKAWRWR